MNITLSSFTSIFELFCAFYFSYPLLRDFRGNLRNKIYEELETSLKSFSHSLTKNSRNSYSAIDLVNIKAKKNINKLVELSKEFPFFLRKIILIFSNLWKHKKKRELHTTKKNLVHLYKTIYNLLKNLETIKSELQYRNEHKIQYTHENNALFLYGAFYCLYILILNGLETNSSKDYSQKFLLFNVDFTLLSIIFFIVYLAIFFDNRNTKSTDIYLKPTTVLFIFIILLFVAFLIVLSKVAIIPTTNNVSVICSVIFVLIPITWYYGKFIFIANKLRFGFYKCKIRYFFYIKIWYYGRIKEIKSNKNLINDINNMKIN